MITAEEKKALNHKEGVVFKPGDRVLVYDSSLFRSDTKTPFLYCFKSATVMCWYGSPAREVSEDLTLGPYEGMVDVLFDHRPQLVSHGHFDYGVEKLETVLDPERMKRYLPHIVPEIQRLAIDLLQ